MREVNTKTDGTSLLSGEISSPVNKRSNCTRMTTREVATVTIALRCCFFEILCGSSVANEYHTPKQTKQRSHKRFRLTLKKLVFILRDCGFGHNSASPVLRKFRTLLKYPLDLTYLLIQWTSLWSLAKLSLRLLQQIRTISRIARTSRTLLATPDTLSSLLISLCKGSYQIAAP